MSQKDRLKKLRSVAFNQLQIFKKNNASERIYLSSPKMIGGESGVN